MSDTIPLLMNTKAGAMHVASAQDQLLRMAREAGVSVDIVHTRSADDLRAKLKELAARSAPRVAVAGGDGTVGLAVQELAHTETALGILFQGTFNNFASTLRLPHNLPESLKMLKDGVVQSVDLGKIGDRYFTELAGVGLFADSLALYGQGTNKNFGRGLYTLARLSLAFRAREFTLTLDGHDYHGPRRAVRDLQHLSDRPGRPARPGGRCCRRPAGRSHPRRHPARRAAGLWPCPARADAPGPAPRRRRPRPRDQAGR